MAKNLRRNYGNLIIIAFLLILGFNWPVKSQNSPSSCPDNLPDLTEKLLNDLPAYTNRVIQRSRLSNNPTGNLYIIVAGKPEFEPLPLIEKQYQSVFPNSTQQVFFTTLERHYRTNQAVTYQSHYWLFLTKKEDKWYLVRVLGALVSLEEESVPLPPTDVTKGAIGQGISLWLRDCNWVSFQ